MIEENRNIEEQKTPEQKHLTEDMIIQIAYAILTEFDIESFGIDPTNVDFINYVEEGNLTDEGTVKFLDVVIDNFLSWAKKYV